MENLFAVHKLNEDGMKKAEVIAGEFTSLLHTLAVFCPENTREFSIVKTKLEEASFFAKKAMASQKDNQL